MVSIIIGIILVLECIIFFISFMLSETPTSEYWDDFQGSLWDGHIYAYIFVIFLSALFGGIWLIASGLNN